MELINDLGLKTLEDVFKWNLIRIRGNRSQADFAEEIGIPLRTYQSYEGGAIPQGPNRAALSKAVSRPETSLFLDPDLLSRPTMPSEPTDEELLKLLDRRLKSRMPASGPDLSGVPADVLAALPKLPKEAWLAIRAVIEGALSKSDPTRPDKGPEKTRK